VPVPRFGLLAAVSRQELPVRRTLERCFARRTPRNEAVDDAIADLGYGSACGRHSQLGETLVGEVSVEVEFFRVGTFGQKRQGELAVAQGKVRDPAAARARFAEKLRELLDVVLVGSSPLFASELGIRVATGACERRHRERDGKSEVSTHCGRTFEGIIP
jgi:hypothetical protein